MRAFLRGLAVTLLESAPIPPQAAEAMAESLPEPLES